MEVLAQFGNTVIDGLLLNWQYFLGFSTAIFGALYARQTAKKKNSTDLLLHMRSDTRYRDCIKVVFDIDKEKATGIQHYVDGEKAKTPEARAIRFALNCWEDISVGISNGIYHEGIIKDSSHGPFLNLYEVAEPFIKKISKKRPTTYQETRWLADRWKSKPLKKKKRKI